ncbi:MAG: hypothetical protein ACPGOV_01735 [Magnetovibrionaceae bacterium]
MESKPETPASRRKIPPMTIILWLWLIAVAFGYFQQFRDYIGPLGRMLKLLSGQG